MITDIRKMKIGMIGLGNMGGGMAENIAKAGFNLYGFDLKAEACERLTAAGGTITADGETLVRECDVVMTCIEGKASLVLAEKVIVPGLTSGKIYIGCSTFAPEDARKLAEKVESRGAAYLEAPVSGGLKGAANGTLRIMAGGSRKAYETCLPLFHAAGNREKVHYFGPAGAGLVAKAVQQLTVRLPDLARLEVMAFGLRAGLDQQQLLAALDVKSDAPDRYAGFARQVAAGTADHISTIFPEWHYFLDEADRTGYEMPMLRGLYNYCKDGEIRHRDTVSRDMPSVWHELMTG